MTRARDNGESCQVHCPTCGCTSMHPESAFTRVGNCPWWREGPYSGTEFRSVTLAPGEDLGDALVCILRGTCGHRWELVLQPHEGTLRVLVNVLEDGPGVGADTEDYQEFNARLAREAETAREKARQRMREFRQTQEAERRRCNREIAEMN